MTTCLRYRTYLKQNSWFYDKSNQLVSSTCNGKVTRYAYDAAGRLVKEGNKTYAYGWLDKVLSVTENGQQIASFNYHNDGQISQAIHDGKSDFIKLKTEFQQGSKAASEIPLFPAIITLSLPRGYRGQ